MYKFTIEEIIENEEKVETGAQTVGSFFSGLSVVDSIKKMEEKTNGLVSKVKSGLKNFVSKITNSKPVRNATLYALAGATALTFTACARNQNNVENVNDGLSTTITAEIDDEVYDLIPETELFKITLNKSKSQIQKDVLSSVGKFLADFNIRFAKPLAENVKIVDSETKEETSVKIQPALNWDEVMAMTLVYNNFSKNEIIEIINGSEMNAYELTNAYNMATLQLMGAHVIETSENPVRTDILLQSDEAKEFYEKYHLMFLKCKETTGEERLESVKAFYEELYKDFPIAAEIREEGIAHSDPRASIEPYKFAVVPMVAASEIMFQNLDIDHTMAQQAIDYFNDIGVCNIADDILEKVETISLGTTSNYSYANYDSVRAALIAYLTEEKAYVIDDEHRDLSQLTAFQEAVNSFISETTKYTITGSYTETEEYSEKEKIKTQDREEAVEEAGEEAVSEAEKKAQEELEKENEEAKAEAEKEADEKAEEMQQEEEKKADELEEEVKKDDEEFQESINNANQEINSGGVVNEEELGNNTNIDSEHTNENGDIDPSIKDITTDPTGAQTGELLPDPNADSYSAVSAQNDNAAAAKVAVVEESEKQQTESDSAASVYEYEEEYIPTTEEEVDAYIEILAAANTSEKSKVYTYKI